MANRSLTFTMLVTSILLIASSAFTQGNFYQRVTKDMEQRDKER
jgi:hypothetical protein